MKYFDKENGVSEVVDLMINDFALIPFSPKSDLTSNLFYKGSVILQLKDTDKSFELEPVRISEINDKQKNFKVEETNASDGKINTTTYYISSCRKYGQSADSKPTLFNFSDHAMRKFENYVNAYHHLAEIEETLKNVKDKELSMEMSLKKINNISKKYGVKTTNNSFPKKKKRTFFGFRLF